MNPPVSCLPVRRLRFPTTVILAFLTVLIGHDDTSKARGVSSDSPPQITEFASVPWGASRERIMEVHGSPDDSFLMERQLSRFPYPGWRGIILEYWDRQAYGQTTTIRFYYDSVEGLRKGEYRFRFEVDDDCRQRFTSIKKQLHRKYPHIEAVRRKHIPEMYSSLCRGAIIGAARWDVWWKDPGSPAVVHLSIGHHRDYIVLEYEGPRWVWWRGTMDEVFLEPHETAEPDPGPDQ